MKIRVFGERENVLFSQANHSQKGWSQPEPLVMNVRSFLLAVVVVAVLAGSTVPASAATHRHHHRHHHKR